MKKISQILILSPLVLCAFANTQTLKNLFPIEKDQCRGVLTYQEGKKKTQIPIGEKNVVYGLTFQGGNFPDYYKMNLSLYTIIQVTLRHSTSTLFDAVLIGEGIPKKTAQFPVFLLTRENTKFKKSMSLLLYSPPQKLQDKTPSPFYSRSGSLTLSGIDNPQSFTITNQPLRFDRYRMKLKIDIELALPYHPKRATLKGIVEFPLYVPKGKNSVSFLNRIARQSRGTYFDNLNL